VFNGEISGYSLRLAKQPEGLRQLNASRVRDEVGDAEAKTAQKARSCTLDQAQIINKPSLATGMEAIMATKRRSSGMYSRSSVSSNSKLCCHSKWASDRDNNLSEYWTGRFSVNLRQSAIRGLLGRLHAEEGGANLRRVARRQDLNTCMKEKVPRDTR
jgi:hypothetical protein